MVEDSQYDVLAEIRKHDREKVEDHTHLEALEDEMLSR